MLLEGRKALVTGAAGGIGSAIVTALRAEGATVAAGDLETPQVASDIVLLGDLMQNSYCDELPRKAADAFGGLDTLVNNAGIMRRGAITSATDEDFGKTMAINAEAPFRLCRVAVPILSRRGGGAIINMASCWGVHPGPDHVVYVMSKAALASLTQCLGRDLAQQGIQVNAICPN